MIISCIVQRDAILAMMAGAHVQPKSGKIKTGPACIVTNILHARLSTYSSEAFIALLPGASCCCPDEEPSSCPSAVRIWVFLNV